MSTPDWRLAFRSCARSSARRPCRNGHLHLELDCASIPNLVRTLDRDPHYVRLHRTDDQCRIRATRLRRAKVELELAHLVRAQGEPGALFTLDSHVDTEYRAHVRRGFERHRRAVEGRRLSPCPSR